ncbi:MAG: protein kinase, partial [Sulfurimonas sp.]|nr:protein kinase [Sulfurimonas sp.]
MISKHYQLIDTLHENMHTVVYRAIRLSDKVPVVIKMLKQKESTQNRLAQFMNEQYLLGLLNSENISKLIDVVASPTEYAHVFEDIGGDSLFDILGKSEDFTLSEVLHIALQIAQTLQYIHQKHIIHADVNPKNIVYNPQTKKVQLIDFGYSIVDNHFRYNNELNVGTSGNLMYMSPEQTGRTKQKIDMRSDMYSFGMTLYHLFSSKPPYEVMDRYELLHKQVALYPIELALMKDSFPQVLSDIVRKLIAKNPNHRYQSDEALIFDLQYVLKNLTHDDEIASFSIASIDKPLFHLDEYFVGRNDDILRLRDAANSISHGHAIQMIVNGDPGVGKTRLIEEFLTLLYTTKSHVIRGKFEQYKSENPYFIFKELFSQIKTILLYQQVHTKVKLDPLSIGVLVSMFPDLGEVFAVKPLASLYENQYKQLPYAIQKLFMQIATLQMPLVIFLDDLQWADTASITLMKKILQETNPYLHLILSYRNDAINDNSSAYSFVAEIKDIQHKSSYIFDLKPLLVSDIEEMLHALFTTTNAQIVEFASLLSKKTEGNPFYLKIFLQNLFDAKLISYENGSWHIQMDAIRSSEAEVDVVRVIGKRLEQLEPVALECLEVLAFLGNRFHAQKTRNILKFMHLPVSLLESLESKGFIDLYGGEFRFVHDLLLHYIVQNVEQTKKVKIHTQIGRYLETQYRKKCYGDIVSLVHHLNFAYENKYHHKNIEHLNLLALREILKSNSFSQALNHLRWMQLYGIDRLLSVSKHSQAFEYSALKAKIFYLNGLHEEALLQIDSMSLTCHSMQERLGCFHLAKDICITQGSGFQELLEKSKKVFHELGFALPKDEESLVAALESLQKSVALHPLAKNAKKIPTLQKIKNKKIDTLLTLLVDYWEVAYYLADINRMQWAYFTIVAKSFEYGNTNGSVFGYVLYGAQLISQNRFKEGYAFGLAAIKLNNILTDASMVPKVHNFMANFISPYLKGFEANLPLYRKSLHQSKVNGDIVFGVWANFLINLSDYFSGKSLETLSNNLNQGSSWILNSGDRKMIAIFEVLRSVILQWQNKNKLSQEMEDTYIALWEEEAFYPALAWYGILKAQTCWFEGKFEEGLAFLTRFVKTDANEVIMFSKLRLHPLRALLLIGKQNSLSTEEKNLLENDLQECKSFYKASPQAFKFWKLLIEAKLARNVKNHWDIAKLYDLALSEARRSATPFQIAAAGVCAGRYWEEKGYPDIGKFYFSEASIGLNQWGAYGTSMRLKQKTKETSQLSINDIDNSSSSSMFRAEPSNYRSLLKSFYALSQS